MVASNVAAPPQPHVLQPKPVKLWPHRLPDAIRLQIRSLYVLHGKPPAEIALALGFSSQQVRNIIMRSGWTAERDQKRDAVRKRAEIQLSAREDAEVQSVVQAVAIRSEELAVRSLDFCAELLDAKDSKGLNAAASAARNLTTIARQARGLDADRSAKSESTLNVTMFVAEGYRAAPKSVGPGSDAITVQATPVK